MSAEIKLNHNMSGILAEGEYLAKAFAFVSLEEFRENKGYLVPTGEIRDKQKILVKKIESAGIKKALKEIRAGISYDPILL